MPGGASLARAYELAYFVGWASEAPPGVFKDKKPGTEAGLKA